MENNSEPLETATAEPTQPQGTAWPFIVYFLVLLLVDGLGFAVSRKDPSEFLMIPMICILYGQTALAMVVGGLMGRNWLEGVYLSTFAVTCQFAIGGLSSGSRIDLENLLNAATIPLVCLMGAFPLILFRWTVGWQLRTEPLISPRSRITIEDLILVPASLVAFCVMALAPTDMNSNGQSGFEISTTVLSLVIIGMVLVLPCTYWAFRIRDSRLRWLLCMGYPFLLSIVGIVLISAFSRLAGDAIGWTIFGAILSTSVFMVGLQLLYSGGYRLVNYKWAAVAQGLIAPTARTVVSQEHSPFDLEPVATTISGNTDPQASDRKRYRIAVVALLIATAIINTGTWTYSQMRQRSALDKIIAKGGSVDMLNGKPIKITFGPSTTEEEIERLPPMHSVKSISVAGTDISSLYLRNNFSSLESMDIRNTALSPGTMGLSPKIQVVVSEGQFPDFALQQFQRFGVTVKQIAD